ncbi:MAG: flagellar biosynthesis protein FlhB, partial [Pseudomonas sp.]|nr:flagellar biosynthesis protein FlhB [Pseudomonas sp.]
MAENENGQDKTEDPTDKRVRDSREKGETARSKELNTLIVTLAGAGGLLMFGGQIGQMMLDLMRVNFTLSREVIMDQSFMGIYFLNAGKAALVAIK